MHPRAWPPVYGLLCVGATLLFFPAFDGVLKEVRASPLPFVVALAVLFAGAWLLAMPLARLARGRLVAAVFVGFAAHWALHLVSSYSAGVFWGSVRVDANTMANVALAALVLPFATFPGILAGGLLPLWGRRFVTR